MRHTIPRWGTGFALLLALVLVISACSSGNSGGNGPNASPADSSGGTGGTEGKLAPYELVVAYPAFGTIPQDVNLVAEAISKIAQEKINAKVKLLPISYGTWTQQMNLMMSGGEKLDLAVSMGQGQYGTQVSSGQLKGLDELLDKYGQGAVEAVGKDYIKAATVNGKKYGVPSIHNFATGYGFVIREDIAAKYGITSAKLKSLDDVEAALKLLKEKEPGIAPLSFNNRSALPTQMLRLDNLGDGLGVLINGDPKVVNLYESAEYAGLVKRMHAWYKAGYINKDAATYQGNTNDFLKSDRGYFDATTIKPGQAESSSLQVGKPMMEIQLREPYSTTSNVTTTLWTIPQHAKNPERSMMFLNLLFSDKDILNLLTWGLEGKHYVKVSDTVLRYPDGVNASNVTYNVSDSSWMYGNQFLSYTMEGDDPEIWKQTKDFNATAARSPALGFMFNTDAVKTELTALANVVSQYKAGLETGALDPEKTLSEFNSKLKSAGLDKVIAEKQRQLDAWLAAKP